MGGNQRMKISEVIELIKSHHYDEVWGGKIDPATTRDKVLYGDIDQECTGIVTCIYPAIDVIQKAIALHANLIIPHESLFWNHGDHTDWLQDDRTFQAKKRLLEENHIAVWRNHDYIHAGVDWEGKRVDGIFYGLLSELNLAQYMSGSSVPLILEIPETPVHQLTEYLKEKTGIASFKCIGTLEGSCKRLMIPGHILGKDNDLITMIENENIDTLLTMESVDFTTTIYMNDSALLGRNRRMISIGHFNMEEPGMKWYTENFLPTILPEDLPASFVKIRDLYQFV